MKEKYEHEKLLNEKKTLQIDNERIIRHSLYIILSIVILIAILIYIYQRKLIQKGNTIQTQEEQLRMYSQQIHENEMQMEQNEIYIAQLSEQLNTNQGLHDAIAEQQNALTKKREITKGNGTNSTKHGRTFTKNARKAKDAISRFQCCGRREYTLT